MGAVNKKREVTVTLLFGIVGAAYGTVLSWFACKHVGSLITGTPHSLALQIAEGFVDGILFGIFLPEVALAPLIGIFVVQKVSGISYYTGVLTATVGFIVVEAVATRGEFNVQSNLFLGAVIHIPIILVFAVAARAMFFALKNRRSAKVSNT
jgi:hypothetical protein